MHDVDTSRLFRIYFSYSARSFLDVSRLDLQGVGLVVTYIDHTTQDFHLILQLVTEDLLADPSRIDYTLVVCRDVR